ncbi:hypothetical protein QFZ76_007843 [Streptomyces sp. V4I2]|nr:hypothetical protein [Streptomyces sp. V4I2]
MPRGAPDSHVESSTTRCSAIFGALRHHGCGAPGRVDDSWTEPSEPPRSRRARRPNAGGSPPGTRPAPVRAARPVRGARAAGPVRVTRAGRTGAGGPGPAGRPRAVHDRHGVGKALVDELVPVGGPVPEDWAGRRVEAAVIDRGFTGERPGIQAEGLLYDTAGVPLKGIHPRNRHLPVTSPASGGEGVRLLLEAAANPAVLHGFEPTQPGDVLTAGDGPIYRFRSADLAVLDEQVWQLVLDAEVLSQLMHELPMDRPRRHEVLHAGGHAGRSRPVQGLRYGGCRPGRPDGRAVPARGGERPPDLGGRARPRQRSPSSRNWPESAGSSPRTPAAWARPYG